MAQRAILQLSKTLPRIAARLDRRRGADRGSVRRVLAQIEGLKKAQRNALNPSSPELSQDQDRWGGRLVLVDWVLGRRCAIGNIPPIMLAISAGDTSPPDPSKARDP